LPDTKLLHVKNFLYTSLQAVTSFSINFCKTAKFWLNYKNALYKIAQKTEKPYNLDFIDVLRLSYKKNLEKDYVF